MLHDMNLQAVVVNLRDVTDRIEANKAFKRKEMTSPGLIYSIFASERRVFYPYASDDKSDLWVRSCRNRK
jgi:hypothetical protein